MFAYTLKLRAKPEDQEKGDEFFRRFKETPGLVHAFSLQGVDDPGDVFVLAVWEGRDAAEAYLKKADLRRDVDKAFPDVTRTMYDVVDMK